MEGANEAARRAVNAILERSGSDRPRCGVWNLHEPDALAPFRAYDRARYRAGLPWDDRFSKAVEAALAMGQSAAGMTAGGAGPLAIVAPFADALSAAGGPLSDPVYGPGALDDRSAPGRIRAASVDICPVLARRLRAWIPVSAAAATWLPPARQ